MAKGAVKVEFEARDHDGKLYVFIPDKYHMRRIDSRVIVLTDRATDVCDAEEKEEFNSY